MYICPNNSVLIESTDGSRIRVSMLVSTRTGRSITESLTIHASSGTAQGSWSLARRFHRGVHAPPSLRNGGSFPSLLGFHDTTGRRLKKPIACRYRNTSGSRPGSRGLRRHVMMALLQLYGIQVTIRTRYLCRWHQSLRERRFGCFTEERSTSINTEWRLNFRCK